MKEPKTNDIVLISFIEEAVMNPDFYGYVAGRVEVWHPGDTHQSEELRFLTKDLKAFMDFREEWDFKYLSVNEYAAFKLLLKEFQR